MAWPEEGLGLLQELARYRGRLALVVGDPEPALRLADILKVEPCRVGQRLAVFDEAPEPKDIAEILDRERILLDLDVLLDPALTLDPLGFLHEHSRRAGGVVAVWPGDVVEDRASYSDMGRFDRYDATLSDTVVLRAKSVDFPDETPFLMERIP